MCGAARRVAHLGRCSCRQRHSRAAATARRSCPVCACARAGIKGPMRPAAHHQSVGELTPRTSALSLRARAERSASVSGGWWRASGGRRLTPVSREHAPRAGLVEDGALPLGKMTHTTEAAFPSLVGLQTVAEALGRSPSAYPGGGHAESHASSSTGRSRRGRHQRAAQPHTAGTSSLRREL